MKITRIVIGDYHQFGYLNIDLTYPKGHPKEGKPLDKVCLIGKNGTGKTTILEIIRQTLLQLSSGSQGLPDFLQGSFSFLQNQDAQFCIELELEGRKFLVGSYVKKDGLSTQTFGSLLIVRDEFYGSIPDFFNEVFVKKNPIIVDAIFEDSNKRRSNLGDRFSIHDIKRMITSYGLLIHSPTEYSVNNSTSDLYSLSNLNEGLQFGNNFQYYHRIAFDSLQNFWLILIYLVQQRERLRNEFENREENKKKTKEELIVEFEKNYPEILKVIANKWAVILDEVGLYFDSEDVKKPLVLTDHLVAFIKDKKTKRNIPFGSLSSGIKNLIFTLGYMVSVYFHKAVITSTAIFDEPEFSLFPDILLKLIDIYTDPKDFPNTQFFFATHSPLIASQFEPEERVCLHFDDERKVYSSRGNAPLGDDPTDLLLQDFGLEEVMPAYGVAMWKKYLELKREIDKHPNASEIKDILKQFADLRREYRFPVI